MGREEERMNEKLKVPESEGWRFVAETIRRMFADVKGVRFTDVSTAFAYGRGGRFLGVKVAMEYGYRASDRDRGLVRKVMVKDGAIDLVKLRAAVAEVKAEVDAVAVVRDVENEKTKAKLAQAKALEAALSERWPDAKVTHDVLGNVVVRLSFANAEECVRAMVAK